MKNRQLDEMRAALRAQGYSSGYIRRICLELADHASSIEEGNRNGIDGTEENPAGSVWERIGSSHQIVMAINRYPELSPIVLRHPVAALIWLPGFLMGMISCGLVLFAYAISQNPDWSTLGKGAHEWLPWLEWFVPLGLAATVMALVCQYRLPAWLYLGTATVLSLGGCYRLMLLDCAASAGFFFNLAWSVSVAKLAAPWLGLAVGWTGWSMGKTICRANVVKSKTRLPSLRICRFRTALLSVIIVASLFVVAIENTRQLTFVHPADSLLAAFRQPAEKMSRKLELVTRKLVQAELSLTSTQLARLDQLTSDLELKLRIVRDRWYERNSAQLPVPWKILSPAIAIASETLEEVLSPAQRLKLERLVLESYGPDVLFLPEIASQLRLSRRQQAELKDLYLERTLSRNREMLSPNEQNQELMTPRGDATATSVLNVLSSRQQASLADLNLIRLRPQFPVTNKDEHKTR